MTIQKRLARSKAMQRALSAYIPTGTENRREARQLLTEIVEDLLAELSENHTRDLCMLFLSADDLAPKERQELMGIFYGFTQN